MILCIDKSIIGTSEEVQRNIDLMDILVNHTKYFQTYKEAQESNFEPLDFGVSIRSMYTNRVVELDGDCVITMSNIPQFIHKGYDLFMFVTSLNLMKTSRYCDAYDELMMRHSQFVPMGLLNVHKPNGINPIIYAQVVLSDEGMKQYEELLNSKSKIVGIEDADSKYKPLLKTLVLVKEENNVTKGV